MTTSITVHLKQRMSERFNLKLNRKARLELVEWIERQCWSTLGAVKDTRYSHRYIITVPLFLCKTLREMNESIKWGDKAVVVYEAKLHRVITAWAEEVDEEKLKGICEQKNWGFGHLKERS